MRFCSDVLAAFGPGADLDKAASPPLASSLRQALRWLLYSNQRNAWRKELANGGEAALSKSAPGPKAAKTSEQKRIEQLEKELAKTQRKLRITEDCVDLQKKALSMLDQSNSGNGHS